MAATLSAVPLSAANGGELRAGLPIPGLVVIASSTATPWTSPPISSSTSRVLYFASGEGTVAATTPGVDAPTSFKLTQPTVMVLPLGGSVCVTPAANAPIVVMELRWQLLPEEVAAAQLSEASLRCYWQPYSTARTYKESIKSANTTSRTLVPVGVTPRFSMGSVETSGPDAVGAHSHPMLEQLFLGLEGSEQTVTADGEECVLAGLQVLHIPLGSMHGVRVEDGKHLHYIWMDFFFDQAAGAKWISDMHTDDAAAV